MRVRASCSRWSESAQQEVAEAEEEQEGEKVVLKELKQRAKDFAEEVQVRAWLLCRLSRGSCLPC